MDGHGAGPVLVGILLTALIFFLTIRNLLELAIDLLALPPVWRTLLSRAFRRRISTTERDLDPAARVVDGSPHRPAALSADARPERSPAAILIPAWREAAVIGAMLETLLQAIENEACHVFLGWYPNDPATARAARRADPRGSRLTLVRMPHDGPTSKADCLNHLYARACRDRRRFAFHVLHDAEDIVAPGEIALLRRALLSGAAMAQLPVLPHVGQGFSPVAHHYADEFADTHTRVLPVRARLTGTVPSAGVGTAITERALRTLAAMRGGRPFDPENLTEDYELSLALARLGAKGVFVSHPSPPSPAPVGRRASGWAPVVAVEECFPSRFADAVRQKARWMIGIALQTPRRHGRFGGPVLRLFLLYDRMMIANALVDALCAALCLSALVGGILGLASPTTMERHALPAMPWIAWLAAANGGFMLHRLLVRAWLGARRHGWRFALGTPLRQLVGVAVNAAAAVRALGLYHRHRRTRTRLVWDKTEHRFPLVAAE